ncbi:ABC transporter ATP-binding protein [Arachidicoccus ginsenosidimutans]|uniref:ABC transporter ATP-binding protein n=1 Tax=Arachidicoccus sp. BS20 TaxID=1850526 RepID=UPI0007F0809C|nr:ABC transporter ATP-binding protein [Arachidicoccus sp. BS20]ANI88207.1 ABC transporter ATP-binding protein [Arachidicoccus sp. BS20]
MDSLLAIQNLSVSFRQQRAVDNISLSLSKGEVLAIVGESGSGKSVTSLSVIRLLSNNAKITGDIFLNENDEKINLVHLSKKGLQQIRGNKIAMIFQEPMTSLNPVKTCGNQVSEAILLHKKISRSEAHKKVVELFTQVQLPDPENIFRRYPHQISGGQKQRVMIAMAMSCEPDLLICDEPTTALDVLVQKEILLLIKKLQQSKQMSVLFISHDLNLVAEIADKIAIFYKGNLLEINTTKEIVKQPKHAYTKALLACRPGLYEKGQRLPVVSDFLNDENYSVQKTGRKESISSKENSKPVLLSVKNLNTWYAAKQNFFGKILQYNKAVNDVSFDVYKNEMLGLVGGSGCGKTTLGRSIIQLVKPHSGKIIYKGKNILSAPVHAFAAEMQMIFQDPYASLNPKCSVGMAIGEPLRVHKIYPEKEIKNKVVEWLEKVGLNASHYNRYPHEFSGGQRQRIVIARALIMQPEFVICDESVSALDVSVQAQVLNLLNDLKKEMGFTSIFISHDLSVVKYLCDRIIVMNKGRIEESGSAEEIYYHPKSDYTRQLLGALPETVL